MFLLWFYQVRPLACVLKKGTPQDFDARHGQGEEHTKNFLLLFIFREKGEQFRRRPFFFLQRFVEWTIFSYFPFLQVQVIIHQLTLLSQLPYSHIPSEHILQLRRRVLEFLHIGRKREKLTLFCVSTSVPREPAVHLGTAVRPPRKNYCVWIGYSPSSSVLLCWENVRPSLLCKEKLSLGTTLPLGVQRATAGILGLSAFPTRSCTYSIVAVLHC